MSEQAERFPLSWPAGWKRTPSHERNRATFAKHTSALVDVGEGVRLRKSTGAPLTAVDAASRLQRQIDLLGGDHALLSSNLRLRLDGIPTAKQSDPADPGAAVYFTLNRKPICLACDKWDRVADNIAALAAHIDAQRRIGRYGVGSLEQAFAGYVALPASPNDWWIVLGVQRDATKAQVDDAFRVAARKAHPDVGGSHNDMARLNEARDLAIEEVQNRSR